ncbi:MAG: transglutaminase family protein [Cyclobacteriaceae bacterium]
MLFISFAAWSQRTAFESKLDQFKSADFVEDNKVMATSYVTNYTFKLSNEDVSITQDDVIDLISLKGNVNYARYVFYNDNIKVLDYDVRYANRKSVKNLKTCGNFQIDNIFSSDTKVCAYEFDFLNEGTEITFKSTKQYSDPKYLTTVFFHDITPQNVRELNFSIPDNIYVELVEKNFEGFNIHKEVTKEKDRTRYSYTIKKTKATKNESNSLGKLYHYPHLVVLTKEIKVANQIKPILASVDDLYQWYASLVNQVVNDPKPLEATVHKLTADAANSEEKIKAIYYWVQDNIKYIAFEDGIAGFRPEAAHKVFADRYGDCKGMANLTKAMLKIAGFDARLTWIGTNRIPYNYDLPTLAVDDHMICTVEDGENFYILDATEKFVSLDKNAERIQGKEMLIEHGNAFIRRTVPILDYKSNLVSRHEVLHIDGESLIGEGALILNGEGRKNALNFSDNIKAEDGQKLLEVIAMGNRNLNDKIEITNAPSLDRDMPFELTYNYEIGNKLTKFDNDLYLQIDWNQSFGDMKMPEDRESDYYFGRKIMQVTTKKIKIPNGYKVSHLPNPINIQHQDFSFNISFQQSKNEVIYSNEIIVNHGIIKKSDFVLWNNHVKALNEIYSDQIIFSTLQ